MSKQNNIKDFFKSLKKVLTFKGILNESDEDYNSVTPNDIPSKLLGIDKKNFGNFTKTITCLIPEGILGIKNLYIDCANIAYSAYNNCTNLELLYLSNTVTSIQPEVFRGCKKLSAVIASPSLTHIGSLAFYECVSLSNLENFNNVNTIDKDAFKDSGYLSKHVDGPIYIGKVLYRYKGETYDDNDNTFTIPEDKNITTINYNAFESKTLKKFVITTSTLIIQMEAFLNASQLEEVYIYSDKSKGGVSIGANSFKGCTALKKVHVNKIGWISSTAFTDSNNIEEFYFLNNTDVPALSNLQGLTNFKTAKFYVDPSLVDNWKAVLVGYDYIYPYNDSQS